MNSPTPPRYDLQLAVETLKRCPLCGSINARQNEECFVCRWFGGWDDRPESIEEGLDDLLDRCPELIDLIGIESTPKPTLRERMAQLWRRVTGRSIDLFA